MIIADELVARNDKRADFPLNNSAAKYQGDTNYAKNEPMAHKLFTAGEC